MLRWIHGNEEGSLPLVLLAAIILGGTIAALFTIVDSGVSSSGRDRDFAAAIQVADAGLQEAYLVLSDGLEDETFDGVDCDIPDWFGATTNSATAGACEGAFGNESEFDWEYTCDGAGTCEVLSVGRHRGSARAVQVEVTKVTTAQAGIVGEDAAQWAGGGGTDSEDIWMGTYKCLRLPASAPDAIVGIQYYGNNLAQDQQDCWQPAYATTLPVVVNSDGPDFGWDPAAEQCSGATLLDDVPEQVERGEAYCVRRAHFPVGFEIVEDVGNEAPVRIYVYNPLAANNSQAVRVGGGGGKNALEDYVNYPGKAADLQIYVSANAGDVMLRPSANIASTIWAPGAECDVMPGGNYRGIIECHFVKLRGTYNFESTAGTETDQVPVMQFFTEEQVPAERRDLQGN